MLLKHEDNRFVIYDDEVEVGYLEYADVDGVWHLNSTFVYPAYRNQGQAEKLVDGTVAYMREHNIKAVPTCSYIVAKFATGGYEDVDAR